MYENAKSNAKNKMPNFYTSTKSWGYIFTVCVSDSACEQISSRTDAPIWTRFSQNGCLAHWLEPY